MAMAKVVRSLRYFSYGENGIRAYIRSQSRNLTHDVGRALREAALPGKVVFTDGPPAFWQKRLKLIAVTDGVIVLYYKPGAWADQKLAEFVPMCGSFKRQLGLARSGSSRWAKIVPL